MLTPIERRQLVLDAGDRPLLDPATSRVIRTARAMIERKAEKIATFLSYRDESASVQESPSAPLVALIKPVGDRCNLRCRYCFNKPFSSSTRMPDPLLETIIAQVLDLNPGGTNFIFHGGEPLLAGIEFFEKAVSFQERYRRHSQMVQNSVMTNGTLLNDEWGKFFSEHKFGVGVSIDGPPAVHDRNRVDASGHGTIDRVMRGISSAQARGLNVGSISVIAPEPAVGAKELFEFITSLGIRNWRVNPCRSREPANRYAEYVEDLFDVWATSNEEVHIALIEETLMGQLGYLPKTCWMKGICQSLMGFEPDGVVSPCCEMSLDPSFHFGNISKTPLKEILQGPAAQRFWQDRNEGTHIHCKECAWTHLCSGGCTYQRLQYSGSQKAKDYLCDTYKDAFKRLTERIDSILLIGGKAADRPVERNEIRLAQPYPHPPLPFGEEGQEGSPVV